ncbi:AMP-binding protein [Microbaculum sp. FT89]|uniref:AMP-binding protein n=1 Tax=Microbaculum sp. FT89 TaxID=3447298 RepID=UPI003F539346
MTILSESMAGQLSVSLFERNDAAQASGGAVVAPVDGKSYVSGDRSVPLRRVTIPQMFAETVSRFGPREAAVFRASNRRFTYYELDREIDRLASGLLALGLEKGDRIGIWSPNRPEWLITQFATARIGLIMVNINPAYRLSEVEYALNKVGCKALIAADRFRKSDYLGMIATLAPELAACRPGALRAERLPALRSVVRLGSEKTPGMFNFEEVCEIGGPAQQMRLDTVTRALDPDDPINIQFTSGTTGAPKGATLTHYNIVNNAWFTVRTMGFSESDRLCIPVPLYHCFGMVLGTLGCVTAGASMVFPGEAFDAGETLAAVSAERCTAVYGVPTMFIAMLDHPDFRSHDVSSLRTGIMAGAPCPVEVMRRVVRDMHMPEVTIGYGMTETSPISFQSAIDDGLEERVSTVGRIHPHVEVKIVDETGATADVGVGGELCTRGYSVMRGYWNDEERTREAIDVGGWMHTGDLAEIDARGYCSIVGRVKDMVIRGGENIYPREIEEFLYRHPKIAEVQVFGVPDEKYGEELAAWIVLQPGESAGEDEIRDYCRGAIAHYKVPRYIRFKDALPMTVTGKPQKFLMREEMAEELQQAGGAR